MQGSAPAVSHPADQDPREFILTVDKMSLSDPFEVTVAYFACDDANTFCVPVSQTYRVFWERDFDGGNPRRAGRQFANGGSRDGPRRHQRRFGGRAPLFRLFDTNENGELDEAELLEAPLRLIELDRDKNGQVTSRELFQGAMRGRLGR